MDDPDGLPSSYIARVLTSLSQWSCKIQVVVDFFQSVEETPNLKANLIWIQLKLVHATASLHMGFDCLKNVSVSLP